PVASVPNEELAVRSTPGNYLAIRSKGHRRHRRGRPGKLAFQLATCKRENTDTLISTSRGNTSAVRRHRQSGHHIIVPCQSPRPGRRRNLPELEQSVVAHAVGDRVVRM